jgi:hypothetical protein
MRLALDKDVVVAPEESMAFFAMSAIEFLRIAAVEPLHSVRKICHWSSKQQVVVGRHEAVRMARPFATSNYVSEQFKESQAVQVIPK